MNNYNELLKVHFVDCGLFISTTVDLATPMNQHLNDIHATINVQYIKEVQPLAVMCCVHNFISTAHSNDFMITNFKD